MRKQITMALTGISISLAMNTAQAQELFLDGGTAGIGATIPVGNTGVGVFTATPISNYFDVNGDVRLNGGGGQDDGVKFASPNGEKGLSIFKLNTGNRADLRYDGTTLKLVAGLGTGAPSPNNGISITNDGNVGIGTAPLGIARLWVSSLGPTNSVGIYSTLACTAPNLTAVGVSGQSIGGFQTKGGAFHGSGSSDVFGVYCEGVGNSIAGSQSTGGYFQSTSATTNIGVRGVSQGGNATGGSFSAVLSDNPVGIDALSRGTNQPGGSSKAGTFLAEQSERNTGILATANGGSIGEGGIFKAIDANRAIGVTGTGMATQTQGSTSNGAYFEGSNAEINHGVEVFMNDVSLITDKNYGIKVYVSTDEANENYGIYTRAESASSTKPNYGIYAVVVGGSQPLSPPTGLNESYAGYFYGEPAPPPQGSSNAAFFNGQVWNISGAAYASDIQFKENIVTLDKALEKIMKLTPAEYTFKSRDEFPSFNFPQGKQYGLIAQEVEKIFPDIVRDGVNPAQYDKTNKKIADAVKFKAIEYLELIPILTAGIQEQQAIIETQNAKIVELEERLAKLEKGGTTGIGSTGTTTINGAALYQNTPNPFNSHTEIGYKLPQQYTEAKIMVFDMNGRQVRTVALTGEAEGKVSFYPNELAAGMYMYSLVIDGREIDTKRMILSGR